MKKYTVDSINYLVWELKIEFEIALTDGGELNFGKSFLHFNMKKISKSYFQFDWKYWTLDTVSFNSELIDSYNNANFYLHKTFLSKKNKILQNLKKSTVSGIPIYLSPRLNYVNEPKRIVNLPVYVVAFLA